MPYTDPLAAILPSLANWPPVERLAAQTGLAALPDSASDILFFLVFYSVLFALSPAIGRRMYSGYSQLSAKARHGFDTHIVSSVNAVLMCGLSFPLFGDARLNALDSYTPYIGFVVAHCVGYFLWDTYITIRYFRYNGWGYLFHALAALYVFVQALRPFMMNYGAPFIWFEASTPFVNVNWFGTYAPGMVSPALRTVNGLALLVVFFLCRIVSGPYHGYFFLRDVLLHAPPAVPKTTVFGVLLCYFVLVGLNFVWFQKMLKIARKMLAKRS